MSSITNQSSLPVKQTITQQSGFERLKPGGGQVQSFQIECTRPSTGGKKPLSALQKGLVVVSTGLATALPAAVGGYYLSRKVIGPSRAADKDVKNDEVAVSQDCPGGDTSLQGLLARVNGTTLEACLKYWEGPNLVPSLNFANFTKASFPIPVLECLQNYDRCSQDSFALGAALRMDSHKPFFYGLAAVGAGLIVGCAAGAVAYLGLREYRRNLQNSASTPAPSLPQDFAAETNSPV